MAQQTAPAFKVGCSDCDLTHESVEFEDASDFVEKHEEHTSHDVEWVRADFDVESAEIVEWHLHCDTCDESWQFATEEAVQDFRTEHAEYTDHAIENEPTQESIDVDVGEFAGNARGLVSLISELEKYYDRGVPERAIYAHFADDPNLVASVKHGIDRLREMGEVYEPSAGRLRTT